MITISCVGGKCLIMSGLRLVSLRLSSSDTFQIQVILPQMKAFQTD